MPDNITAPSIPLGLDKALFRKNAVNRQVMRRGGNVIHHLKGKSQRQPVRKRIRIEEAIVHPAAETDAASPPVKGNAGNHNQVKLVSASL